VIWIAALGGIAAWLIHLAAEASLVRLTCQHHAVLYAMHAVTAVAAAATLGCIAMSWRLRLASDEPHQFVGAFGVVVGAVNLALIVLEGSFVLFIHTCA
jgi:hypothetical protein